MGGVIAEHAIARALHREENVPGVLDRGGQRAVFLDVGRRIVEADVEDDAARLERLEGADQVRVGLARQRPRSVLLDRRVVDRDDRDLVPHRGRRDRDRAVVDDRLEGRVEHLDSDHPRAEKDRHERQDRDNGTLARVALRQQATAPPSAAPGQGRRQIMRSLARLSTP